MSQDCNEIYEFKDINRGSMLVSGSRSAVTGTASPSYELVVNFTFSDGKLTELIEGGFGSVSLTVQQSAELRENLEQLERELIAMDRAARDYQETHTDHTSEASEAQ